jgi:hypothetical protein
VHLNIKQLRLCRLPITSNAKLRIAQLTTGYSFDAAERFLPSRWKLLPAWAPNALIASAADLQRVMERIDMGTLKLNSLDHSIHVLTELGDKPLTDVLRDVLWQRFAVPIFELYTGARAVLAYECEAHDGWHIEPAKRLDIEGGELVFRSKGRKPTRTGLFREIDGQPCLCGRPGARIVIRDLPLLAAVA